MTLKLFLADLLAVTEYEQPVTVGDLADRARVERRLQNVNATVSIPVNETEPRASASPTFPAAEPKRVALLVNKRAARRLEAKAAVSGVEALVKRHIPFTVHDDEILQTITVPVEHLDRRAPRRTEILAG